MKFPGYLLQMYTPPGKLLKQEESSLDEIGFSFVKKCISVLEQRGLEDQGLYRLVGVNSKVQKLLQISLGNVFFSSIVLSSFLVAS